MDDLTAGVWKRYCRPGETPDDVLRRVADFVGENTDQADLFFGMMQRRDFLPNSPTLMNAGKPKGQNQLAACFVVPIKDDMASIMEALSAQVLIHKSGGGTGFNFSALRPAGSKVGSTDGVASGPVSFMRLFDTATEVVSQGGMRRGANMGILEWDHADILTFIRAKVDGTLTNFNLSVAVDERFFTLLDSGDEKACHVWDEIAKLAWATGDPGLIFLDRINASNTTPWLGDLEATNPCGESPLYPWEACNLGSINLANFARLSNDGDCYEVDYDRLCSTVHAAVRFLDQVIDRCDYPLPQVEAAVLRTRKIGLGVMGWADLLAILGYPYDSDGAVELARHLGHKLDDWAWEASHALAQEKSAYPAHHPDLIPTRNATQTCIAPTGSLSILAGCSAGIEPNFARSFTRRVHNKQTGEWETYQANAPIVETLQAIRKIADDELARQVPTATEIAPYWHIRHQAAWQESVDLAVSKTINLPGNATVETIKSAYRMAYRSGCKGITVYRDGSKDTQVITNTEGQKSVVSVVTPGRPEELTGKTRKVPTVFGTLYVTLNTADRRPYEVFCTVGKGGREVSATAEALGRLISLGLRAGVHVEDVVRQLKGIAADQPVFDEAGTIHSLPDGVARALEKMLSAPVVVEGATLCPECGAVLLHTEGCLKCDCGYSRC